ncbi:MAG: hypothetical protein ABL901_11405 [Hyphomicrobiaceae bacterium]
MSIPEMRRDIASRLRRLAFLQLDRMRRLTDKDRRLKRKPKAKSTPPPKRP